MPYEIELINVGRAKINRLIEAKKCFGITEAELRAVKELGRCVMSSDYFIEESDETGTYNAFVGMGRPVGTIKIKESV